MQHMGAKEYRAALAKVGLSQVRAALFFGVSERKSRRWAAGDYPVDKSPAMILRYMVQNRISPHDFDPAELQIDLGKEREKLHVTIRERKIKPATLS